MSYLRQFETLVEVISITGELYGRPAKAFEILGRRNGATSTTVVNDIKEFDDASAVDPVLNNEILDIISSSMDDDAGSGLGVRTVKVTYIDSDNNLVESGEIKVTGTSVNAGVLGGVNAVLWMESFEVGSGLSAAGNIRLRINGGVTEVEQISAGTNKSLSAHFMVPTGYTGYIYNWKAHAINANQQMQIVATVASLDRSLSTAFHAQGNSSVGSNSNSGLIYLPFLKLPALARVKVNTISSGTALTVQADTSFVVVIIAD